MSNKPYSEKREEALKMLHEIYDNVEETPMVFHSHIYDHLDIAKSTYEAWCNENSEYYFSDFSDTVKKIRGKSKNILIKRIDKHGEKSFPANAWLLERSFKEEFAKVTKVDADVKGKISLEKLVEQDERVGITIANSIVNFVESLEDDEEL